MKQIKEIEEEFKKKQNEEKAKIKAEPSKWKRFWKRVWHLVVFPWKWIWVNIRDRRTALIFVIVFLVVSSEVWVPYFIGFICWSNEPLRHTMFGIGSACWLFWAGPGTPFLIICIGLTMAVKSLFNKIKYHDKEKSNGKKENKRSRKANSE